MTAPEGAPAGVVIDASVGLKWVIPEADSCAALALRDSVISGGTPCWVPDLFWAETANVLWRLTRGRGAGLEADEAMGALEALRMAPLSTVGGEALSLRALEVACAAGITAYDASYVAVAELKGARLWTADRRLVRALEGTEWEERVAPLPPSVTPSG